MDKLRARKTANKELTSRERISHTDALVNDLKRFFRSDAIKVGDKLPSEMALCDTYQVGRSTVREAVRTLQVMGYVELKPGRGAFLAAKTRSQVDSTLAAWITENRPGMEETLRIRQSLETLAIRFAVEKASDAELARVDMARLAYEDAFFGKDYASLTNLDEAFHRAIISATHSEMLTILNSVVSLAFREWRERSFKYEGYGAQALIPHQRISAALLARDRELGEIQIHRHLEEVLNIILSGGTIE